MNKVYSIIYSVVGILILISTEKLHHIVDSDNKVIIFFLYLPMLFCSLFMIYKLISSKNQVAVSDFVVIGCFYEVIGFILAVIPLFVRSLGVDRLFLSNIFTYLITYLESLFILASKKITNQRISKLIFCFGNIVYIVAIGGSLVNCFFALIKYSAITI